MSCQDYIMEACRIQGAAHARHDHHIVWPNGLPISAASAPQDMSKNLGSRARSGLLHGRVSLLSLRDVLVTSLIERYRGLYLGSSGLAVNTTISRGGCSPRTEPTIAFEIKRQPLKQPPDIAQSVAPPFEYLEFVV